MPLVEVEETQPRVFGVPGRVDASSDGELAENLSALRDDVLLEERAAPDEKLRPVFVDGRASGR
jgi:hypothetical protein